MRLKLKSTQLRGIAGLRSKRLTAQVLVELQNMTLPFASARPPRCNPLSCKAIYDISQDTHPTIIVCTIVKLCHTENSKPLKIEGKYLPLPNAYIICEYVIRIDISAQRVPFFRLWDESRSLVCESRYCYLKADFICKYVVKVNIFHNMLSIYISH